MFNCYILVSIYHLCVTSLPSLHNVRIQPHTQKKNQLWHTKKMFLELRKWSSRKKKISLAPQGFCSYQHLTEIRYTTLVSSGLIYCMCFPLIDKIVVRSPVVSPTVFRRARMKLKVCGTRCRHLGSACHRLTQNWVKEVEHEWSWSKLSFCSQIWENYITEDHWCIQVEMWKWRLINFLIPKV